MKILLVGATGVIGRLLLPLLVQAGHTVLGTTRRPERRDQIAQLGGTPVILNALDRAIMFYMFERMEPEVVIHQMTDLAERDFAANARLRVEGTRNLVDASRFVGVQQMIAQSISWVCVPGEGPAQEDDPLDLDAPPPRRGTVAAVKALEDAVAEMPRWVVLRYGLLYGPGTWHARDGLVTEQVRRGELVATDGVSSFVHVADAAQAACQALDWPSGVFNIVDDEPAAGTEWLAHYAKLVGAPQPRVEPGAHAWERGESNARARALGWHPAYPTWRTGFVQVLA